MKIESPRYLTPFHPKHNPHQFVDVLIIGGGIAGMRAALAIDPSLSVLVVTKDKLQQSNSRYAQGGIASVTAPDDAFVNHVDDTMDAGGSLCNREIVEMVVEEAPRRVEELIDWDTHFDSDQGELQLGREGGHSHFRILHALGDATGREIVRAMIEQVSQRNNLEVRENTFTLDLLTHDDRCQGALVWSEQQGQAFVWAKQVILCTGGAGQIYRETTNPDVATGDGHALAYRAGAELRDMEFMQFHPTVLYIAGSSRSLITEAIRGEGAYLVDRDGRRFMVNYDERAELAPRDVVSQAIVDQMNKQRHPNVYLDLCHLDATFIHERFPGITHICQEFGLDVARDRIPVRPGAHYMIGGVSVDRFGRTTLPGLWAAGEVTSTGLHGANRLASNSLLEGLVYGAHAGEQASLEALDTPDSFHALPLENIRAEEATDPLDLEDIRNSLKSLMWRSAGVRREKARLVDAQENIEHWRRYVLPRQFSTPDGWELQNMITVAQLMIHAALEREESRGVHWRSDFPNTDDSRWKRHIGLRRE